MNETSTGRPVGKPPALTPEQQQQVIEDYASGEYTYTRLQEVYGVGRATLFRILHRERAA